MNYSLNILHFKRKSDRELFFFHSNRYVPHISNPQKYSPHVTEVLNLDFDKQNQSLQP